MGFRVQLLHARPKHVKSAACQEVIHRFAERSTSNAQRPTSDPGADSFSLFDLPILKCWPKDGGRFITLPNVPTRDPETGARNLGMYRMQLYDSLTAGMHWQVHKVGARHGKLYYERNEPMPVAVTIGGDPAYTFAATAPLPDGLDEILFAGFLRRKSVELVPCLTNESKFRRTSISFSKVTAAGRCARRAVRRSHRLLHRAEDYPSFTSGDHASARGDLSGHHVGIPPMEVLSRLSGVRIFLPYSK
jgi:4-hydroxy-3-polyprenylbenzoate decarboxylase